MEEEMRKKLELIQQIKAESISVNRNKLVDLTSNAGHGLLTEMSIAELYERLELVKRENEEYNRKKRDDIIKSKIDKEQQLVEKLNYVTKFRNELTSNMNDKRYQFRCFYSKVFLFVIFGFVFCRNKEKEPLRKIQDEVENSEAVLKLKRRVEEKKQERIKAQKEAVERELPQSVKSKQFQLYANQRVQFFFRFIVGLCLFFLPDSLYRKQNSGF
jgi:hypothetical protein